MQNEVLTEIALQRESKDVNERLKGERGGGYREEVEVEVGPYSQAVGLHLPRPPPAVEIVVPTPVERRRRLLRRPLDCSPSSTDLSQFSVFKPELNFALGFLCSFYKVFIFIFI